jgi:drug/metabolite transporter (DMT)-like permease
MNERTTALPRPALLRPGLLLMLASTAGFTANVLLIRALSMSAAAGIWMIVLARFVVGLGITSGFFRRELELGRVFTDPMLVRRGVVGALGTCGFYLTVEQLGAGRAVFIGNSYVIMAGLMAIPMLGERFRPTLAAGGIGALVGLALLTDAFGSRRPFGAYELVALAAAVASAYVVITIRQLHARAHTSTIFAAQCVWGILFCLGPALLHAAPLTSLGALGLLASGLAASSGQLLMTRALRELPVAQGTLVQMLVPVGVAAGGLAFFGESLSTGEMAGGALVLAGCLVTTLLR